MAVRFAKYGVRLKCGNVELWDNDAETVSRMKKAMKSVQHLSIDQVWKKFRRDKSKELRYILIDHYMPITNDIVGSVIDVRNPNDELHNVIRTSGSGLENAIDAFDEGRGEKFESYCTPRIRRMVFAKVRSKDIKEKLRILWRRDCFVSKREKIAGRFRSMSTDRQKILKREDCFFL